MKTYQKVLSILGVSFLMLNSGCSNLPFSKDQKVENAFEKHLSIYPVKQLEDFYDMEGYRDKNFDKDDKGTWVLSSYFAEQDGKDEPLKSKGIVLFLNRNNKTAKGNYYIETINDDIEKNETIKYPITVKNNKLVPKEEVSNEVKKEIENYRLVVQDESFGNLGKLKKLNSSYSEQVPLYTVDYELPKGNKINKWVRNKFSISEEKANLFIELTGDLRGSSSGDFKFKILYGTKGKNRKYYREKVIFQPTKEEEYGS
ncbi:tandem-type lipoprotein [Macrococcus capreoli]|uniref:tandem-type lipoprotein n=1 Tax=Macrococcus capreoli TaxID=2982690 RepID=UPI003F421E5C